jgi:hypothetical protein
MSLLCFWDSKYTIKKTPYNKENALFCPFYGQNAKKGFSKIDIVWPILVLSARMVFVFVFLGGYQKDPQK